MAWEGLGGPGGLGSEKDYISPGGLALSNGVRGKVNHAVRENGHRASAGMDALWGWSGWSGRGGRGGGRREVVVCID